MCEQIVKDITIECINNINSDIVKEYTKELNKNSYLELKDEIEKNSHKLKNIEFLEDYFMDEQEEIIINLKEYERIWTKEYIKNNISKICSFLAITYDIEYVCNLGICTEYYALYNSVIYSKTKNQIILTLNSKILLHKDI